MKEEIENRITELREHLTKNPWEITEESREACEYKLKRLELLLQDMTTFYQ